MKPLSILADLTVIGVDKQTVLIPGQTTVTDGFNATYRWSASSTATSDGLNIIQIGSSNGRWLLLYSYGTDKTAQTASIIALQSGFSTLGGVVANQGEDISQTQADLGVTDVTVAAQGTDIVTLQDDNVTQQDQIDANTQGLADLTSNTNAQLSQLSQSLNNYPTNLQMQAAISDAQQQIYGGNYGPHIAVPNTDYTIADFNSGAYFYDSILSTGRNLTIPSAVGYDGRTFIYHNITAFSRTIVGTNVKTTNGGTTITSLGGPSINTLISNNVIWTLMAVRTS